MKLSIILTTLLNTFATTPDLCAELYLKPDGEAYTDTIGQTLSRYCKWTGPDAPVFAGEVCCTVDEDGAACSLPSSEGRCWTGSKWYCEHAVVDSAGGVVCYQPFPSACGAGHCVSAPELPPDAQASLICCNGGACVPLALGEQWDCEDFGGTVLACHYGVSNTDGTVTCYYDY